MASLAGSFMWTALLAEGRISYFAQTTASDFHSPGVTSITSITNKAPPKLISEHQTYRNLQPKAGWERMWFIPALESAPEPIAELMLS